MARSLRHRSGSPRTIPHRRAPVAAAHDSADDTSGPRVAVRRATGPLYVLMAVCLVTPFMAFIAILVFLLPAAVFDWSDRTRLAGITVIAIMLRTGLILGGPAARFVVTERYLVVDTVFRRVFIPRCSLRILSRTRIMLVAEMADGEKVPFRVDSPVRDWGRDRDVRTPT
jgi:hypothetical protein